MSVQYYRKFAAYRVDRREDMQTMAEFVIPCTIFHGDLTEFSIKLIRICKRTTDNHFVVTEGLYKFEPETRRFQKHHTHSFDKILQIIQRFEWMFDQKHLNKLARAGLVIPLHKAVDRDKVKKLIVEIRACAAAALL